ncbi:MAG: hypothetical protein LUD68_02765 [Rikenellaceae bacterium]|nr:hypothetical protein [Rikenellaceae bacterium]
MATSVSLRRPRRGKFNPTDYDKLRRYLPCIDRPINGEAAVRLNPLGGHPG